MSSCTTVHKEQSSKELSKLKNLFDCVEVVDLEKFRLLTLKNKSKNANIDWVVWLQVKVQYSKGEGHSAIGEDEVLFRVCTEILNWVDLLINFDNSSSANLLSLFEDDTNNELEELPPSPINGEGKWDKHFRDCNRINKNNLMKQYSFFELLDIRYHTYTGIDYRKQLPSCTELRELLKNALVSGMKKPGRYDDFWLDTPEYILNYGNAMSDIELILRLCSVRLFLLPHKTFKRVWTDNSFSASIHEAGVSYRYYLNGTKLSSCSPQDNDKKELPSYSDIYDDETLQWIRNTFNIKNIAVISDEDILRGNIKHFMRSILGRNRDEYDFEEKINFSKDWKNFKSDVFAFLNNNNIDPFNGGGSGYSLDGFRGGYDLGRKGEIVITQNIKQREKLNRNIDLPKCKYSVDSVEVFNLKADEIYKKAFELFKTNLPVEKSLFDFLAA